MDDVLPITSGYIPYIVAESVLTTAGITDVHARHISVRHPWLVNTVSMRTLDYDQAIHILLWLYRVTIFVQRHQHHQCTTTTQRDYRGWRATWIMVPVYAQAGP